MEDYTTEDLKNLGEFIKTTAKEATEEVPPDQDGYETLMKFYRQIEAIRFNPLIFKSILKTYTVNFNLMDEPLKKVALHINDAGILSKTLVKWRLTNGR